MSLHNCYVNIDNTANSYDLVLSAITYQKGTFTPPLSAGGSTPTTVAAGSSMKLSLAATAIFYGAEATLVWVTGDSGGEATITMSFQNVLIGSNIATIAVTGSAAAQKAYGVSYLYASAGDSTGTMPMSRDYITGSEYPLRVNYSIVRNRFVDIPQTFLPGVKNVVLYMLENRALDHLLGQIYTESYPPSQVYPQGSSPLFAGVGAVPSFSNTNPSTGVNVIAHRVPIGVSNYDTPDPDPGETWEHVNTQIFNGGSTATMSGFIADYLTQTDSTNANTIMAFYTAAELPVISGLATGHAICDAWFCSVPTQTYANRAFSLAGTSSGLVDNEDLWPFHMNTLFNVLTNCGDTDWAIYHQDRWLDSNCFTAYQFDALDPLLNGNNVLDVNTDFLTAAQNGTLPAFSYIEPAWYESILGNGNDYHPPGHIPPGEVELQAIYAALTSNQHAWASTLLIVTFDEHGGTFDHVAPPAAIAPDQQSASPQNFDFTRLGVRVPTLLISPLIPTGMVFRAPGSTPFDHTSLVRTILGWRGIDVSGGVMGARAAVAPDFSGVLSAAPANRAVLDLKPNPVYPASPDRPLNDLQRATIHALAHSIVRGQRGSAEHRELAAEFAEKRTWGELKTAVLRERAKRGLPS